MHIYIIKKKDYFVFYMSWFTLPTFFSIVGGKFLGMGPTKTKLSFLPNAATKRWKHVFQ
jgi:hypothetical protein